MAVGAMDRVAYRVDEQKLMSEPCRGDNAVDNNSRQAAYLYFHRPRHNSCLDVGPSLSRTTSR